jgi:hypothetical protein
VFRWTRGSRLLPLHASECDEAVAKLLPGGFGVYFVVFGGIVELFAACCAQVLLLAARRGRLRVIGDLLFLFCLVFGLGGFGGFNWLCLLRLDLGGGESGRWLVFGFGDHDWLCLLRLDLGSGERERWPVVSLNLLCHWTRYFCLSGLL